MKIKILVVPTLIIASGFVTLNYLKPDFDTYMQKKALRDTARENASQAETIAQNVQSLKGEISSQSEKVNFVKRYLPADKDQGRTFDSLNFLVNQSGLLTSKIQTAEVKSEEEAGTQVFGTLDPVADADPLAAVETGDPTLGGAPLPPPYVAPKVKKYSVTVDALGSYSSIREALTRLTAFDRLQEVKGFKITAAESVEGEEASGDTLTLMYTAELPYQPTPDPLSGEAIVAIPGLNQGTFNFEVIDNIRATAAAVPDVVLGTEGKANPFVN